MTHAEIMKSQTHISSSKENKCCSPVGGNVEDREVQAIGNQKLVDGQTCVLTCIPTMSKDMFESQFGKSCTVKLLYITAASDTKSLILILSCCDTKSLYSGKHCLCPKELEAYNAILLYDMSL